MKKKIKNRQKKMICWKHSKWSNDTVVNSRNKMKFKQKEKRERERDKIKKEIKEKTSREITNYKIKTNLKVSPYFTCVFVCVCVMKYHW